MILKEKQKQIQMEGRRAKLAEKQGTREVDKGTRQNRETKREVEERGGGCGNQVAESKSVGQSGPVSCVSFSVSLLVLLIPSCPRLFFPSLWFLFPCWHGGIAGICWRRSGAVLELGKGGMKKAMVEGDHSSI